MYSVGLMSGTSLDGVDAVLTEINGSGMETKVRVIAFNTYEIPENIKLEIKKACLPGESSSPLICSLNFKLGKLFSEATRKICREGNISPEDLDFVASHGQTIYHIPKAFEDYVPSTLQIGEPAIIALENNVRVVSNFRTMDMAAGGEGAPLVPYSEFILYGGRGEDIALQNIGGIGNVTFIPGDGDRRRVFAFDTGPGNMMIDEACQRLFNLKYDKGGEIAKRGKVINEMLDKLMNHPYVNLMPPKSTGREEFGEDYVENLLREFEANRGEDIIATLTAFTAETIIDSYKKYIIPKGNLKKVIVAGGGAHNKAILDFLRIGLSEIEVLTQEDLGYSSDAKEAIAFVILGNETIHGKPSNMVTATGASRDVILGNITPKPNSI